MGGTNGGGHRGKTISGSQVRVYMNYEQQQQSRGGKAYLDDVQLREIIAELGDAACLLLSYLLRVAAKKEWGEITDENCARQFGWKVRKAQKVRLALEKGGYMSSQRFYANGGKKMIVYYIGKEAVEKEKRIET